MIYDLDDDDPLWLVNEQIKGLLEGDGANEDHAAVLTFLRATGLPEGTVVRIHRALVFGDSKVRQRTYVARVGTDDSGTRALVFRLAEGEDPEQVGKDLASDFEEQLYEVCPVEDFVGKDLYELVTL